MLRNIIPATRADARPMVNTIGSFIKKVLNYKRQIVGVTWRSKFIIHNR